MAGACCANPSHYGNVITCMRRFRSGCVCAAAVGAALVVLPQAAAAEPDWCASYDEKGYGADLSAPVRLVFDREGSVKVSTPNDSDVQQGRVAFINGQGEEAFGHELTPAEMATLNDKDRDGYVRFPIRVGSADGPMVVRLSYSWRRTGSPLPEAGVCDNVEERTVWPFEGTPPRPRLRWNDWTSLDLRVACYQLAPGELRVVFRHRGRKRMMLLRTDPCRHQGDGSSPNGAYTSWSQSGARMPGLRFYRNRPLIAYQVGGYDWKRTYRIDVFWRSQQILRRWLWVSNQHEPGGRIYENDADAFYRNCDADWTVGTLPVRKDARGRRYCVYGPGDHARGHLFATPPPWR